MISTRMFLGIVVLVTSVVSARLIITPDSEYDHIGWASYEVARNHCTNQNKVLCSYSEYCPNGVGGEPLRGRASGYDVWAPIGDLTNDWVQISHSSAICRRHSTLPDGLPTWGNNGGCCNNNEVLCCTLTTRPFFEHAQELNLNGVSDRVDVSDDFNTLQGGEMTFAFRATQKSIERNYERAWDWSRSCGSAHVFADVYTSLRMTFQVYGLGYVTVDNFWELGVEHVYAFVVSNTHMKVYRDGIEMGSRAVNGGIGHGVRDQFYMGGSACDSIQRWHANVKWFRVWTEALPEKMIKDLNIPVTTQTPTMQPSSIPTLNPTSSPSLNPTSNPSLNPTSSPTSNPTSSPTSKPTTNPSKRPTAEDFIVKVKAFHGEPKDVLDASKLQDQPDVDAEFFGFEHKLTPFTRRLLNRFYDVGEQGFGREEQEFA